MPRSFGWVPLLLHGLRIWASVCLALYVAFRLELGNPFWAGTSAAIVCQPALGASLRKGWFRMIGTVLGATFSVLLTAAFPQSRVGFMLTLAVWGAICGLVASLLRNFASYSAALAGYTAVIICSDVLGSVATATPADAFPLAVTRATEICIGIVCAGVVVACTDLGTARRRLAERLSALSAEIAGGLVAALSRPAAMQGESRAVRRGLIPKVADLGTLIDQALGESPALRFRPRPLQAALDGLFTALSGWRAVATHVERQSGRADADATAILRDLPPALRAAPAQHASDWVADADGLRRLSNAAARALVVGPAETPSARLLADHTAKALLGLYRALSAVVVLEDPRQASRHSRVARLRVPDALPPLVNAIRVFLAIGVAELIWVATAWPDGGVALEFVAVTSILFSPREDAAYTAARGFMLGTAITAGLAAIVAFAVLPQVPTFLGFCLVCGVVLIPAGALSAQSWHGPIFLATAANFIPLLGPSNPMVFDPGTFFNTAIALLSGVGIASVAIRLLPPLTPARRAQRLVALTLRDLRRLAAGRWRGSALAWESHVYGRLTALPDSADPVQGARLVAALSAGSDLIRLQRAGGRFGAHGELARASAALARGDSEAAVQELRQFDRVVSECAVGEAGLRLRARGNIAAIAETLMQHSAYFNGEVSA